MLKINNFGQFFQFFNSRRNIAMWFNVLIIFQGQTWCFESLIISR